MNGTGNDLIWAGTLLASILILCLSILSGWKAWLALRRQERSAQCGDTLDPGPAMRIEMANLKERLRKLEAIATGVDL